MTDTDRRAFLVHTAGTMAAIALIPELEPLRRVRPGLALKVGVVGVGRHGRAIISELQKMEGVEVAAVCDTSPTHLVNVASKTPGVEGFADHRALLEKRKDIPAIVVATPSHLHRAIAVDAIDANRHVYCEAPLATTIDDCRAIVRAAEGVRGRVHQAGLYARSNPIYQLAHAFFKSDAVRELVSMYAQFHRKTSWRFPAADPGKEREANWRLDPAVSLGLAGEVGTGQFDLFHWFRGSYPTRVRGSGGVRVHTDGRTVADTIHATLTWPDRVELGYSATLGNSYGGQYELMHGSNAAIKLTWTHGWMFKEADAPTQGWEVYANRQQIGNEEGITLIVDATKLAAQGKLKEGLGLPYTSLYYALADFVKSIEDLKPPITSLAEGMRATVVSVLTHRAIASGTEQAIPADLLQAT